jgi:uncharacterized protein (TIGR02145 family)
MKNVFKIFVIIIIIELTLVTCKKETKDTPLTDQESLLEIPKNFNPGVILLSSEEYAAIPVAEVPVISTKGVTSELTLNTPRVLSQGSEEGSCVAWGIAYAGRTIMWMKFHPESSYDQNVNIFSPEFVYNQVKLSSDCLSGSKTTLGFELLMKQGVCRWSIMPYIAGCSTLPNETQKSDALNYKILGYATVPINSNSIKPFLIAGYSIIVAGPIDNNYQLLKEEEILKDRGSSIGNHCYCVVGYDDTKNAFKIMNSWGPKWASSGFGWIDYDYINQWWQEAYIIIDQIVPPTLTTTTASSITSTTATSGGIISYNGRAAVSVSGVCWSTSLNPTISLSTKTTDGSTSGVFSSTITGLSKNTLYYVRAYATNSAGTGYGNQISFTTNSTEGQNGTVADIEGNIYNTVVIGAQTWMAENLKTTQYNDGTSIPNITVSASWAALTTGAYCDNINAPVNSISYGRLYNWFVAASFNPRNVCPTGWHVPSDDEWHTLILSLDPNAQLIFGTESAIAGGYLKEIGFTHWASPNTGATNSSGFSAFAGAYRDYLGTFATLGYYGCWWSSIQGTTSELAWYRVLSYDNSNITRSDGIGMKAGLSIRCIKDN